MSTIYVLTHAMNEKDCRQSPHSTWKVLSTEDEVLFQQCSLLLLENPIVSYVFLRNCATSEAFNQRRFAEPTGYAF